MTAMNKPLVEESAALDAAAASKLCRRLFFPLFHDDEPEEDNPKNAADYEQLVSV